MTDPRPTLHLLCGKIAAGKSTLAARLAAESAAVLIRDDDWLATLYPGEIAALEDYVRCSRRLREAIGPLVVALLGTGVSVVLDFPANTLISRHWMRGLIDRAGVAHALHVLDVPDEVCKARLVRRNRDGGHPFAPSEADYELFTRHFVPPSPDEGFTVVVHAHSADASLA